MTWENSAITIATLLPLVALAFVMGIVPNLFLARIETSVSRLLSDYQVKLTATADDDRPRLLEIPAPDAAHVARAEEAP